MSTIFSENFHEIKIDSESVSNPYGKSKKVINIHENENSDPKSVLNRIKLNNTTKKPKHIVLKKSSDNEEHPAFDIARIQKKKITKDLNLILRKPKAGSDSEDYAKGEANEDSNSSTLNNMSWTVIVRNLPRGFNEYSLEYLVRDFGGMKSIKIDNGVAEIGFNQKDSARKASESLDGRIVQGSKINAKLITEVHTPSYNLKSTLENREAEIPNYYKKEHMAAKNTQDEDNNGEKDSVFARIKKNY